MYSAYLGVSGKGGNVERPRPPGHGPMNHPSSPVFVPSLHVLLQAMWDHFIDFIQLSESAVQFYKNKKNHMKMHELPCHGFGRLCRHQVRRHQTGKQVRRGRSMTESHDQLQRYSDALSLCLVPARMNGTSARQHSSRRHI